MVACFEMMLAKERSLTEIENLLLFVFVLGFPRRSLVEGRWRSISELPEDPRVPVKMSCRLHDPLLVPVSMLAPPAFKGQMLTPPSPVSDILPTYRYSTVMAHSITSLESWKQVDEAHHIVLR